MSPAARLLYGLVLAYRYSLSAFLGRSCRFTPSCSAYALEALEAHGALRGGGLAARRVMRCHPWGGAGYDPVPPAGGSRPTPGLASAHPLKHRLRGPT